MSLSKFKVHDRVVITTTKYDETKYRQYLLTGRIVSLGHWITVKYDTRTEDMNANSYLESDIELEQVFHSPLYQELK